MKRRRPSVLSRCSMEFGALHYSASELNSKAHPYQLTRSDQIYLTLDTCNGVAMEAAAQPCWKSTRSIPTSSTRLPIECVLSPARQTRSNRKWHRHKGDYHPEHSTASRWMTPLPISRRINTRYTHPLPEQPHRTPTCGSGSCTLLHFRQCKTAHIL